MGAARGGACNEPRRASQRVRLTDLSRVEELYRLDIGTFKMIQLHLFHSRQHPSYGDCLEVKREYYRSADSLEAKFTKNCANRKTCGRRQVSARTQFQTYRRMKRDYCALDYMKNYILLRGRGHAQGHTGIKMYVSPVVLNVFT